MGSSPEVNHLCGGDRVTKWTRTNETHNIKASTLVRCIFGPLKGTLEVEGRIINQLDLDVGRIVILAICDAKSCIPSIHTTFASSTYRQSLYLRDVNEHPWFSV